MFADLFYKGGFNVGTGTIKPGSILNYELHDTDFVKEFKAISTETGVDVISPIVQIYEDIGKNVPANLAKLVIFLHAKYSKPRKTLQQYIYDLSVENDMFKKHLKDVEKYLAII